MNLLTTIDVLHAQRIIANYLGPTPLHHYPTLDTLLDARVYIKHGICKPIGSFKLRSGINLMSR